MSSSFVQSIPDKVASVNSLLSKVSHSFSTPPIFFNLCLVENISCPQTIFDKPNNIGGWSSSFKRRPSNAGPFSLKQYDAGFTDKTIPPPKEIIDVGIEFRKDDLISFFLDKASYYSVVKKHVLGLWRSWER